MNYLVEGVHRSDFVKADVGTSVVQIGARRISSPAAFRPKLGGAAEYVVIPALALLASLVLFGIFVALFGQNPLDLYFYMYQGAFGTWFSWQNTLTRAAPLMLTALCTALPAQLGMVVIGGEGALLIGGLCATSAALALPRRAAARRRGRHGDRRHGRRRRCGSCWSARCANIAASTRRSPACCSSISPSRSSTHLVEGPMRDPASLNKPSTPRDRRRQHDRQHSGHRGALGPGLRHRRRGARLYPDLSHGVRLRRARGRRQYPRRARSSACRVGKLILIAASSPAPPPGSPAWSRSRRCRAAPTPISRPATASPASWSPSWRGTIRSRSFRSRSCSAASAPAAACCSAGSTCPMRRCWCCRASSSSACWRARRSTAGCRCLQARRACLSMADAATSACGACRSRVLGGAMRVSTPFLFVSLGECITETSGRINLGLEGTLVMGAMSGYGVSYLTGSPWLGVLAAGIVGALLRRAACRHLQPAAGQRHRRRHRADAVRHRARLLSRQAA